MSHLEDRLRDAFGAAAATVAPGSLPGVPAPQPPRRAGRHLLVPLAAAASVAAVIAAVAVVLPLVFTGARPAGNHPAGGPSPAPPTTPAPPPTSGPGPLPGAPRFLADLPAASGTTDGPLQVRSTVTGKVVATAIHVRGTALTALAGGRTFLIATPAAGNACATRLQRFTLSASGQPGPLTPLPVPALPGQVASLAASANGRVVAYADGGCGKGSQTYLGVVDVTTGVTTRWTGVDVRGEGRGQTLAGELSITADGRLLVYETSATGTFGTATVRALPTSAPAGTAAERSHVIARFPASPRSTFAGAAVSPGGTTLDVCTQTGGKLPFLTLASYDAATGHRLRVLATLPGTGGCGPLDPSGRFLLVSMRAHPAIIFPGRSDFLEAEVALATGRTAWLTVPTPSGAMSSTVGAMLFAW